jgi:antibiotic biosynthesis monooxygenase (ABM) superfamily enzyme
VYGTIARFKLKKECLRDFLALGKEWDEHERVRTAGYINSEILWEDRDAGRACLVVHFTSKDAYVKNANSPEQDRFYQRMRACMEDDPEWIDGTYQPWDSPYGRPPAWAETAER